MIDNEHVLEGFLNGQNNEMDRQRIQLIRILSRSGTLPKVSDLQVKYIHSQPEMFLIDPGKQIRIGIRLLSKPVLALVALRYGIEWQVWYNAIKKYDKDFRVCDLAAARVAIKFIELLPQEDQKELEAEFPADLAQVFSKIASSLKKPLQQQKYEISFLQRFHKKENPEKPINQAWFDVLEHLAIPTEYLLMSGGDVRLNIENQQLLNVYGCRPFPRPEAFTFASSTATSVSNISFDLAQKQREKLIKESFKWGIHEAYRKNQQELIVRLKQALRLGRNSSIIISPSGTDISLLFAGMCQSLFAKKIAHILVASDETGSGVPLALEGRHFANVSALNKTVVKEERIEGFEEVDVQKIPLRDANGVLKTKEIIDQEVDDCIKKTIAAGLKPVLHVMDQSKLGYAAPSQDFLIAIAEKFKGEVLVLVDNSQLRMPVSRIEYYIKLGFLMTVTGSKFYTGPPFSGALVVPEQYAELLKKSTKKLPVGLKDYFLKSEFIQDSALGESLSDGYNFGSYLRWYAALMEMERYFKIPITLRNLGVELFCEHVEKRIENSGFLENLEKWPINESVPLPNETRTIFPFFILKDGKVLSHAQADKLYRLLNNDISTQISFESESEIRLAKQVCHIGQPVKVFYHNRVPSAVLRISLGSRVLSESWKDRDVSIFFQRVESQMNQVDIICNKISLILKYADLLGVNIE